MPVESAADRAVFVNADEFGSAASWTAAGGSAVAITGIFDDGHEAAALGDLEFSGPGPRLLVPSTDVPGAAQGDAVTIGAIAYAVRDVQPDGTGMTLLLLERS